MPTEPQHTYSLDAYAKRLGLAEIPAPTLEGLKAIAHAHVCSIPFESLDPFLYGSVSLERPDLEVKLLSKKRGGYCFEQNGLMLGMLRQIGFQVQERAARVLMGRPRDIVPPRTHLFLIVTIEGREWIADFGVGSFSLTQPIRFALDIEQDTPHDIRRIVHENDRFYHQVWLGDHWFDLYTFTGERMPFTDQNTGNWLTSTHPTSMMKTHTVVAIARPGGIRATYLDGVFTVRRQGEVIEQRTVASNEEAIDLLSTEFGIQIPDNVVVWRPDTPPSPVNSI